MRQSLFLLCLFGLLTVALSHADETSTSDKLVRRELSPATCGKVSTSTRCGVKYGRCAFGTCSKYSWCGTTKAYKTAKNTFDSKKGCKRPTKKAVIKTTKKVSVKLAKKVKKLSKKPKSKAFKNYVIKLSKAPRKTKKDLIKNLSSTVKTNIKKLCSKNKGKKVSKKAKKTTKGKKVSKKSKKTTKGKKVSKKAKKTTKGKKVSKKAKKTTKESKGKNVVVKSRLTLKTKKAIKSAKKGKIMQIRFNNVVKGYSPMVENDTYKHGNKIISMAAKSTWRGAQWTVRWLNSKQFQLLSADKKFILGRYSWLWAGLVKDTKSKSNTFTYDPKTLRIMSADKRCLDVWRAQSTKSGVPFVWWSCHKGTNQKFRMQVLSRSQAKKMVKKAPKKVMKRATKVLKLAKTQIAKKGKGKKAMKKLIKTKIVVRRNRLFSKNSGKKGLVKKATSKKTKLVAPKSRMARIINVKSGKSLDIWGGKQTNLNKIVQWKSHGGSNQKFRFVYMAKNRFRIVSFNGKYVFGQFGTQLRIMLAKRAGLSAWMKYDPKTKAIISMKNKKCLDVSGGSKNNGARINWWKCHGGSNQKFTLKFYGNKVAKKSVSKSVKVAYKKVSLLKKAKKAKIAKNSKVSKKTVAALKKAKKGTVMRVRFSNVVKGYNPTSWLNRYKRGNKIVQMKAGNSKSAVWTVRWISKKRFQLLSDNKKYILGRYSWLWAGLVNNTRSRSTTFSYCKKTMRLRSDEGKCLDVWHGKSSRIGQPFVWWSCHNGTNQKFRMTVLGKNSKITKKVSKKSFNTVKKVLVRARKTMKKVIKAQVKKPKSRVVKIKNVNSKLDLDCW